MTSRYRIGIVDVAREAGVSAATVSRAINHPDALHPATRRRVEDAIRATGYVRNRAAQTMHGKRSATIGLVVPTVDYSIFAELVQSFNDTVAERGFTLLLATHGYDLEVEYRVLRKLMEHRVDAVALVGLDHSEDTWRLLDSQDVPAVAVWSHSPTSRISCIGADNSAAGRIAVEHVLALGHRRIGFVFPPTADNDRARARFDAARAAMVSAGLGIDPAHVAHSLYSIARARIACLELLDRAPDITAIVCGNDIIAQGAIAAAALTNRRLPDDISVVGIGDFAGSGDMVPALTTVRLPARSIGEIAGRYLVNAISDPGSAGSLTRQLIPVELLERSTTGRAAETMPEPRS